MNIKEFFHDEQGAKSMGRICTLLWTLFCIALVGLTWATISPAVLAFLSTVELAFVSWTAGPRIASYLAPQISAAASAIGKARAGRDVAEGIEPGA